METENINERYSKIVNELYENNKSSFAKAVGVSPTVIENILGTRKGNPGFDVLQKTIYANANISPEWLLIGKGSMLRSDTGIPAIAIKAGRTEGIPLIPASAMAGVMSGDIQILEYECERYVVPIFKEADFLIPIKGSSMYPKYSSGDIVACKKLTSWNFFQYGKVYVLYTNQGAIIKRIKEGDDKDHLLIVSDNERYPPFQLDKSEIISVALVVGVIRLE